MLNKEELEKAKTWLVELDPKSEYGAISKETIFLYIEQLEAKIRALGKGQRSLMVSRRKWKHRYYRERRKRMCQYCEKEKRIEENQNDNIYFSIWGKHLRVSGRVLNIPLGRDVLINYCPMCGRKLGE